MKFQENAVTNLCSFYVSDWHLVTMLLPYISKSISEGKKIATILEKDIEENINSLVERLNLKTEKEILKIDWTSTNAGKYTNISKKLDKNISKEQIIIINGTKDFIKIAKENVKKYIQKNRSKLEENNTKIRIISCYEIIEFNGNIQEILNDNDKILNTSGEKEIIEVFEDYERKEKIS